MPSLLRRSVFAVSCIAAMAVPASAAPCSPTGFVRDGINLTAALINPPLVTHEVDAAGCHIGVYFTDGIAARVKKADIHGATYFGVVVNGENGDAQVDVLNSQIHDIGESPLNGTQHGVAIYYRSTATGTASGQVTGNHLWNYQKGGIVANFSGTRLAIAQNTVTGQGPVAYIAQNGIQVGYGGVANVVGNTVSGHSYTGSSTVSGGIVVVGGAFYDDAYSTGSVIAGNVVTNNDIGVYLTNLAADGGAPDVPTDVTVIANIISSSAVTGGYGYQAGISDVGNGDRIVLNAVSGAGYNPATQPGATFAIDADPAFTKNATVFGNRIRP
jgi:hypothetical protein